MLFGFSIYSNGKSDKNLIFPVIPVKTGIQLFPLLFQQKSSILRQQKILFIIRFLTSSFPLSKWECRLTLYTPTLESEKERKK